MEALGSLTPFILIAVVFWLLLIRPQRRRQLEMAALQRELAPGDEVMLGAGIFGTVASADDEFLHVELSPGVVVRVVRGAVVRRILPEEPAEPTAPERGAAGEPPTDDLPADRDH